MPNVIIENMVEPNNWIITIVRELPKMILKEGIHKYQKLLPYKWRLIMPNRIVENVVEPNN